jgi:hypothetical protein
MVAGTILLAFAVYWFGLWLGAPRKSQHEREQDVAWQHFQEQSRLYPTLYRGVKGPP